MTNLSDYPITVDGVRLDNLAKGLEASAFTTGSAAPRSRGPT